MAYQPYTVEGFGGLNVRDDPAQVGAGGAIDLSNVIVDQSGILQPRPGYAAFSGSLGSFGTSTGSLVFHTQPYNESQDPWFTVLSQEGSTSTTRLWTLLEDGTTSAVATLGGTGGGSGWLNFAPPFHTATHSAVTTGSGAWYVSASSGTGAPSAAQIAGLSTPRYITRTQASSRLAVANFLGAVDPNGGTGGKTSVIWFSAPNGQTSWGADDWVDVGETITGLVLWNDQVFVFGTTTLFLFYSETPNSAGGVDFNLRPIAMNIGIIQEATVGQAACAGPDGVYFATSQGIWRTQGGAPVKVSRPIDPILTGDFLGSGVAGVDKIDRMTSAGDRVFVSYGVDSDADGLTLVYDVPSGQWSRWDIGTGSAPTSRVGSTREDELYYVDATAKKVMRSDPDLATDNGSSMSWRYQSGWYDLGSPERKVIRESLLWGTGSPTFGLLTDYATSDSLAAAVTLGTDPTVAEGRQRIARRGVLFSHKVSGTAAASVSRLTHHLAGNYRPGADPS